MVFALVGLVVLALLGAVHRYLWRRFVGDTTAPGSPLRRAGTVAAFVLPLLSVGAMTSGRVGAPFWLQQVLAWPGFLWLACLLYLTLALLVGEVVRPVLLRVLARRDGAIQGAGARAVPEPATAGPAEESGTPADVPDGTRPRAEELVPSHSAGASARSEAAGRTATEPVAEPATEPERERETEPAAGPLATSATAPATTLAPGPSRRLFVSRVVGGAAAAAGLATVGYGTYGVLRGPSVRRITVPLAKLPRAAHGFRIAVVSDIHIGPILGRAHTRRIVDTINATSPDLVAVVGDLVDGSVADLGSAAEPLSALRARHGSFFVTGNHEYFSGAGQWVDHVRELGLHPLENARVEIEGFDLAGVNDIAGETEGQGPDFGRALGDRDRGRAAVLLAHQPVVIHDAVEHGVDLQLSGHTHGGQLWPGNLLAELGLRCGCDGPGAPVPSS
ncbi:metallophosphoesterase [Streptomyces sp. EN16]|uniref:metallophosphoesterase n=1 Tax=Streptomyces sp. EN16 TaxID=212773 RepID=UPI00210D697C|nr:metallophosphoesterase [Streptomyces sp. EN16]